MTNFQVFWRVEREIFRSFSSKKRKVDHKENKRRTVDFMRQTVIFQNFFEKKIENFNQRPNVYALLESQYLVLSESLLLLKIGLETTEI